MVKYIITSGISMIKSINSNDYKITNDINESLLFDTIGDAMRACIKINPNNHPYKVKSYEIK